MVFASIEFICIFLPIVLLVNFLMPRKASNQDVSHTQNIFQKIGDYQKQLAENLYTKPYSMHAAAKTDYTLFRETIVPSVFLGKEDNLFYDKETTKNDLLGQYVIPREELDEICRVQQETKDALSAMGVKYMIVVAPGKESVYTDYLFDIDQRDGFAASRREQVVNALRQNTDVEVLDLTESIREEQQLHPTYMKSDSHWNYFGSFRGYQEIIKYLQNDYPSLPLLELDDFDISYIDTAGNLVGLAYLNDVITEKNLPLFERKGGWNSVLEEVHYPNNGGFAGEVTGMIVRENPNNEDQPNIMMLGDSFLGWDQQFENYWNINSFMSESAHRYVRYHYYGAPLNLDLVRIEKSDVVIREFLDNTYALLEEPFISGTTLYMPGTEVSFLPGAQHPAAYHTLNGVSVPEAEFTWSDGDETNLSFYFAEEPKGVLRVDVETAMPFLQSTDHQTVEIYANDMYITTVDLYAGDTGFSFDVPKTVQQGDLLRIRFAYPNAEYPASGDTRKLAVAFRSITIEDI